MYKIYTVNFQVINEDEGEDDKIEINRKSDIIPDKVENSCMEEHDMSISTLHLYDLHLAKVFKNRYINAKYKFTLIGLYML